MLSLNAYIYNCMLDLRFKLEIEFFLKNLDFARTFLLSLRGISREASKILACFSLAKLSRIVFFIVFILNWEAKYYLKDLLFLLANNLSYLDL